MAYKRTGGNPDDDSQGVLTSNWTDQFFQQQDNQNGYGAVELIKSGKTDRPDDQLLRTVFDSDKQAQGMASMLARARQFNVTPANEFCTFLMEAKTAVKGLSRRQYLQGITGTYDFNDALRTGMTDKDKNKRPIQAGD